jgi:hypothetical protein
MRLHSRILAGATATMLTLAGPALAAGLSSSQVKRASTRAAQAVGRQTHATSVRVISCRATATKALCHAEGHYTSGAKRCTFDVTVTKARSTSQAPRAVPSNFVCY